MAAKEEFSGLPPEAIAEIVAQLPNGENRLVSGPVGHSCFPTQFLQGIPFSDVPEEYRSEEINKEIGEELGAIQNWLDAHPVEKAKVESGTSRGDDFKSAWIVWKHHGVRTRLRNGEVIHISLRMPWPWTEPLVPAVARVPFDEDYLTAMDIETTKQARWGEYRHNLAEKKLSRLVWVCAILALVLAAVLIG